MRAGQRTWKHRGDNDHSNIISASPLSPDLENATLSAQYNALLKKHNALVVTHQAMVASALPETKLPKLEIDVALVGIKSDVTRCRLMHDELVQNGSCAKMEALELAVTQLENSARGTNNLQAWQDVGTLLTEALEYVESESKVRLREGHAESGL